MHWYIDTVSMILHKLSDHKVNWIVYLFYNFLLVTFCYCRKEIFLVQKYFLKRYVCKLFYSHNKSLNSTAIFKEVSLEMLYVYFYILCCKNVIYNLFISDKNFHIFDNDGFAVKEIWVIC